MRETTLIANLMAENDKLRHDIARHVQITADQAQELEELRAELAAAMADYEAFANSESTSAQQLRADLAAARAERDHANVRADTNYASYKQVSEERDNWAALCAATGEDLRECKADLAAARALLAATLDAIENHATQRTFAGGVVLSNTTIKIRAALAAAPGAAKREGEG